ncbi:MAG: DUF4328 domain-containing protein [Hyphomonas sp.]|nr:DUF4328 domain-containing protein [Hyphomonas sp.]
MSSVEFGPNGSVVKDDSGRIDRVKQELAQKEHAYPDGKPRPVETFAKFARIGLIIWSAEICLQTLMLAGYYFAPQSLPGGFFNIGGNTALNVMTVSGWLLFLTAIATFTMVGRFTYRAQKNLFTVGSPIAKMAPGWTVGWYFIPIAAIWQPFLGMSQIYRGTYAAIGEAGKSTTLLAVWWGAWISLNVPDWISRVWEDSLMMTYILQLADTALGVTAALALARILGQVAERQALLLRGGVALVFD